MNADKIRALLRIRYCSPEWALCFEVSNATGSASRRFADAVAMNLYPSRGLSIHGFEIKCSKSDFMNEIKNPEKSIPVQQYCDHWWLVAPASAVDESLIPQTWGWLRVDGDRLVCVKQAPQLDAKDVTRQFMAALVRRSAEADEGQIRVLVDRRVEDARKLDRQHVEREIETRSRKASEALKLIEDLKQKLGDDGWRILDVEEIAKAVKLVRQAGLVQSYGGIRQLQKELKSAHDRVTKALEAVTGKQVEMDLSAAE